MIKINIEVVTVAFFVAGVFFIIGAFFGLAWGAKEARLAAEWEIMGEAYKRGYLLKTVNGEYVWKSDVKGE